MARSYAPDLAAFTQLDSVAGSAQNPLNLNRYLYADGNPERLIDPSGHTTCDNDKCKPGPNAPSNPPSDPCAGLTGAAATDCHRDPPTTTAPPTSTKPAGSSSSPVCTSVSSCEKLITFHAVDGVLVGPDGAPVSTQGLQKLQAICDEGIGTGAQFTAACNATDQYWSDVHAAFNAYCAANESICQEYFNTTIGNAAFVMQAALVIALTAGWAAPEEGGLGTLLSKLEAGTVAPDVPALAGDEISLESVLGMIPENYLTDVQRSFDGTPEGIETTVPTYLFKYSSAAGGSPGFFFTSDLYDSPDAAIRGLALPSTNNGTVLQLVQIQPTRLLFGVVANQSGREGYWPEATGGGVQFYVPDASAVSVVYTWP